MDKEYLPLRTQDSFILSSDAFFIANARSTEMAAELVNICNSHAKLVEALEAVLLFDHIDTAKDHARQALQQLKENDND